MAKTLTIGEMIEALPEEIRRRFDRRLDDEVATGKIDRTFGRDLQAAYDEHREER